MQSVCNAAVAVLEKDKEDKLLPVLLLHRWRFYKGTNMDRKHRYNLQDVPVFFPTWHFRCWFEIFSPIYVLYSSQTDQNPIIIAFYCIFKPQFFARCTSKFPQFCPIYRFFLQPKIVIVVNIHVFCLSISLFCPICHSRVSVSRQ